MEKWLAEGPTYDTSVSHKNEVVQEAMLHVANTQTKAHFKVGGLLVIRTRYVVIPPSYYTEQQMRVYEESLVQWRSENVKRWERMGIFDEIRFSLDPVPLIDSDEYETLDSEALAYIQKNKNVDFIRYYRFHEGIMREFTMNRQGESLISVDSDPQEFKDLQFRYKFGMASDATMRKSILLLLRTVNKMAENDICRLSKLECTIIPIEGYMTELNKIELIAFESNSFKEEPNVTSDLSMTNRLIEMAKDSVMDCAKRLAGLKACDLLPFGSSICRIGVNRNYANLLCGL